jgi:predicted RNA-binding Zn-ribbon protein involved in translation (DUF1610 family)
MKGKNSQRTAMVGGVQTDESGRKVPIQSDLEGRTCPNCGSRRYSLVFRVIMRGRFNGLLAARCSRCRKPRTLIPDELTVHERDGVLDFDRGCINNEHNRRGESHDEWND